MRSDRFSIIADIGGTNARFALLEEGKKKPIEAVNLVCADYASVSEAIRAYLEIVSFANPVKGSIAIATPVVNDNLEMTNHSWRFSINETRKDLELSELKVMNDFTALALAIPHLSEEKFHKVGGGEIIKEQGKAVIGPGTGLGVSGIFPLAGKWYPLKVREGMFLMALLTKKRLKSSINYVLKWGMSLQRL